MKNKVNLVQALTDMNLNQTRKRHGNDGGPFVLATWQHVETTDANLSTVKLTDGTLVSYCPKGAHRSEERRVGKECRL